MMDLRHRRMQRCVEAYLDGYAASPRDGALVEAHLAECWDCSGDADTLRLIKHSLRHLATNRPADMRAARVRRWAEVTLR